MVNYLEEKLAQFKELSLSKQSLIAITAIGATIAFVSNYSNIKEGACKLYDKYSSNENVKEFTEDIKDFIKPITEKVMSVMKGGK